MHDLVVRGGRVYDGSGKPPIVADVAVSGDRVASIAHNIGEAAAQEIDARGLDVVPGFIDLHGHSDFSLTIEPSGESLLRQGVTTQLVGNCGTSAFPLPDGQASAKFDPTAVSQTWSTASEYFEILSRSRPSPNVGSLVGLGTVRRTVLNGEPRSATPREVDTITGEVEDAFTAGALGVSLGLHFEPDLHATGDELMAIARLAASHGRVVAIHLRDYGHGLGAAVEEALRLGRSTGARIHISLLHAFGRAQHGALPAILDRLDVARSSGVAVTCEALLWPTVGAWDGLRAVLPPEVYDWRAPDWQRLQTLCSSARDRQRLGEIVEQRRLSPKSGFYEEYIVFSDWRDLRLLEVGPASSLAPDVGRSVADIAEALDRPPIEVFLHLLAGDASHLMLLHQTLSSDDLRACLGWPHAYVGLDAIATSGARHREPWNTMQFHPRHFGGTARLFATFVRAESLLTSHEAVRRLTSGPAAVLGLPDRGVLRAGSAADLAILDLDRFAPTGTWFDAIRFPVGVHQVVVGGQVQLSDSAQAGTGGGQVVTGLS